MSTCSYVTHILIVVIHVGHYKIEIYDKVARDYVASAKGLGVLVEVKDPSDSLILSRVRG